MSSPTENTNNVTALPVSSRGLPANPFAAKIEHLEATIAALQSEIGLARSGLAMLTENTAQAQRMRAFEESLRNARENKIDEILRSTREIKDRLDRAEGDRAKFAALPVRNWEALNAKLALHDDLAKSALLAQRIAKIAGGLLAATIIAIVGAGAYMYRII